MTEFMQLPGVVVRGKDANPLIASFLAAFRVPNVNLHPQSRTWVLFPQSMNPHSIGNEPDGYSLFDTDWFNSFSNLFLYEENRELRTAACADISNYFKARQPWDENRDLYVFTAELNWCIAVTHDAEVIVVGNIPSMP